MVPLPTLTFAPHFVFAVRIIWPAFSAPSDDALADNARPTVIQLENVISSEDEDDFKKQLGVLKKRQRVTQL